MTIRAPLFSLACVIACGLSVAMAQGSVVIIALTDTDVGKAPTGFSFQRTGEGDLGQWTVIRGDPSADQYAIEHVSTDQHDDRFPLSVYEPLLLENGEVSLRFKIVSGTMLAAGLAIGVRTAEDYYAISASALEKNVSLDLFVKGKRERVESAEAEVERGRWHKLGLVFDDDHFRVSLDTRLLFTTFDRMCRKDGRFALWTQEDNVTRFGQIEIRTLPPTKWQ